MNQITGSDTAQGTADVTDAGPAAQAADKTSRTPVAANKTPRGRARKRRSVGRTLGARVFLILFALSLTLGALSLSGKPIPLPVWVVAEVENRLNAAVAQMMPRLSVSVGAIDITVGADWVPRLRLSDTRLLRDGGQSMLTLPETRMTLDPGSLMSGQLHARSIMVSGARIALRRGTDGRIDLALGPAFAPGAPGRRPAPRDLGIDRFAALFAAADRAFALPALAGLQTIEAEALSLSLTDQRAGQSWALGDGRFRLDNRPTEFAGDLSATLQGSGPVPARATLTLVSEKNAGRARVTATMDQIPAADLAAQTAVLEWLRVLDAPISGRLAATIDKDGLSALDGRLDLGAGALRPSQGASPLAFEHATMALRYDPAAGRILLTDMQLESTTVRLHAAGQSYLIDTKGDPITGPLSGRRPSAFLGQLQFSEVSIDPKGLFEEPLQFARGALDLRLQLDPFALDVGQLSLTDKGRRVLVSGRVSAEPDGWRTALDVSLDRVTRDGLLRLWPLTAVPPTRTWIERNLLDGLLSDVKASFRAAPGTEPRLHLDYKFDEASLRVLPTLPPVEGARGYATLSGQTYTLVLSKGRVTPAQGSVIDAGGSVFAVPDITAKPARGQVTLVTRSDLTAVLSLLDQPPFQFMTKAKLPVTLGRGRADLLTRMSLPLGGKLSPGDLNYKVTGTVRDFATDLFVPGKTITAPELAVATDPQGLTLAGKGLIGSVPFDVTLTQRFAPPGTNPATAPALPTEITGTMTLSQLAVTEFGLGLPPGMVKGEGPADIRVTVPRVGNARLALVSNLNGVAMAIPELGWSKSAEARGRLEADVQLGTPPRVDRLTLSGAGLQASGVVNFRAQGGLEVARFSRVQLNDWLDAPVDIIGRGANQAVGLAVNGGFVDLRRMPAQRRTEGAQGSPLALALDRLQVADGISLTRLRGVFSLAGGFSGDFRADVNGTAAVRGAVTQANQGTAVRIQSDDAGAVMAAAGVFASARGGSLDLTLIPRATSGHYDGRAAIADIRVVDANVLAELLNAMSVVGMLEQLNYTGIVFGTADADFVLTPDAVQVTEAAAIGASLGVSMAGLYRTADKRLKLQGVISPIYLFNGVGAIVSRRGEGLFGFNYSLGGTADAPEVSVNPLSILTPGLFREIFRTPAPVLSSSGEVVTPAPKAPPPKYER